MPQTHTHKKMKKKKICTLWIRSRVNHKFAYALEVTITLMKKLTSLASVLTLVPSLYPTLSSILQMIPSVWTFFVVLLHPSPSSKLHNPFSPCLSWTWTSPSCFLVRHTEYKHRLIGFKGVMVDQSSYILQISTILISNCSAFLQIDLSHRLLPIVHMFCAAQGFNQFNFGHFKNWVIEVPRQMLMYLLQFILCILLPNKNEISQSFNSV